MNYVTVRQKKCFFKSITDWLRWNYRDGKIKYSEGVDAFTLEELGATTASARADDQKVTAITAIGDSERWKRCKVVILRDEDIIDGTVALNWQVPMNDDIRRFLCLRITPVISNASNFLMTNAGVSVSWKRVPLAFSERGYTCFGKSFIRETSGDVEIPNVDGMHWKISASWNTFRDNSSPKMASVQFDARKYDNKSSSEIGADFTNTGGIYRFWNIDRNTLINLKDGNEREHYRWIFINGLMPTETTKTLTIGASNITKLTAEDIRIATDKGWTLA